MAIGCSSRRTPSSLTPGPLTCCTERTRECRAEASNAGARTISASPACDPTSGLDPPWRSATSDARPGTIWPSARPASPPRKASATKPGEQAPSAWFGCWYGSRAGLSGDDPKLLTQEGKGETLDGGDRFGATLAAANFGGSAHADLAIGVPRERVGDQPSAGIVHVFYGTADGLTRVGNQIWSQLTPGITGVAQANDQFGELCPRADADSSAHRDESDASGRLPAHMAGGAPTKPSREELPRAWVGEAPTSPGWCCTKAQAWRARWYQPPR